MTIAIYAAGLSLWALLLWLLSGWSSLSSKHYALLAICSAVTTACIGLVIYGLFFSAPLSIRPGFAVESFLEYILVPLFLSLPAAVTVLLAQGLLRWHAPSSARIVGFLGGTVASLILPYAALAAGCGLAGACL